MIFAALWFVNLSACAPAPAADGPSWPRFHGPNGDNISTETGLLKEWPEDGPKLLWTAKGVGAGFAGVTVGGGLIFTSGNKDDATMLTALDLAGQTKWQAANGGPWTKDFPGTRGTPTLDGDRLYHLSPIGELGCFDAQTGKKHWSVNILEKFNAENIRWALAESLVIDGDRILCCPGGPDTAIVALSKKDGAVVWKSPSAGEAAGYCTPALTTVDGLRMVVALNAKAVIAVNADNGELLWRHPHETAYDVNVLTPICRDGQVFVSTGYGAGAVMLKVKVEGKKASVEKLWDSKEMDNHHGGVILRDGCLFGTTHNANRDKMVCLDWKTGQLKWAERGVGKGSATVADGLFYTLSEKSQMGLARATPEKFELISKFKLPADGEGPSWAHPVVCGGRLYVRHGDCVFAFDVKATP
jgi:outer membrane protein assembly factor BamB